MKVSTLAIILGSIQQALAAPVVVTRMHTADAVTVTDTYSTVTNTHTAPTVEILVSDGVTYTFTLTDATYSEATTFTSIVNKAATTQNPTTTLEQTTTSATTEAEATTAAETTVEATTAAETTAEATAAAEPTTTAQTTADQTTATEETTTSADPTTTSIPAVTTSDVDTTTFAATTTSTSGSVVRVTTTLQAPTAAATSIATDSTTSTQQTTSSSSTSTSTATGSLSARPTAIVYSPYNDDSSCKDYDTVQTDLELIASTGISKVRVYGTDCNSITTVLPIAADLGITVNQGFWISSEGADSIDDAVSNIISYGAENGWGVFDFFTVGNEAVQAGYVTVSELKSKISSVRTLIEAAGYSGKFTTSEPPVIFEENPELCTADVDFIGVNPHAYFDTSSSASTAGTFVKGQVAIVKKYCTDMDIMVTETGYPSAGIQNGGNIPSVANQKIAIEAILSEMDNEVTILSTYNDYWKEPGEYGIEQSFGVIQLFE